VIDALFGAGLDRPLSGAPAAAVAAWRSCEAQVVAVDVPSGLDGDSGAVLGECCPQAVLTVTFCRRKPGHLLLPGRDLCGETVLADIGIDDSIVAARRPTHFRNVPALWAEALRRRQPGSHKYDFGSLLIRGGGHMTGAARLAGRAALRSGAGLVTLAGPPGALTHYALAGASAILAPCDSTAAWKALVDDRRRSALLVGPGNGVEDATRKAAEVALASGKPCLLDGDGLGVFAGDATGLAAARRGPLVVTPHEGEFARLFPDLNGARLARARSAAEALDAVVVLKGSDTLVASPDGRVAINDNAPPSLAVAGSGDVLSGIVASLMAQGLEAFAAAQAGVWLHGEAAAGRPAGLIADDLPDRVGEVLVTVRKSGPSPLKGGRQVL